MKRIVVVVLLCALIFTLCSCGKGVGSTIKFGSYEQDGDVPSQIPGLPFDGGFGV